MINLKRENGVTLLVLMVTVIILIILTAVLIDVIVEDRTLDKARNTIDEANNKTQQSQEIEENTINNYSSQPGKMVMSNTSN